MARGVYGRCLKCYREIGMPRLTALPHASFCIPCQEDAYYRSDSIKIVSQTFSEEGGDDV
jgi:RNA polymerase-binding transcription factor DksA